MARILDRIQGPEDLEDLSLDEMRALAAEIREEIQRVVFRTGGHLASNLGTVEIALALHRTFRSPRDLVVWDTGHQAYAHKLLTGRREGFRNLRQWGGVSGFSNRFESPHDTYLSGHAGTAVSAALGMAMARKLSGEEGDVLAIVGDAALGAGVSFEALNAAAERSPDLIVILNDNEMSISRTVGALSRHLSRIRLHPFYHQARKEMLSLASHIPTIGGTVGKSLEQFSIAMRSVLTPGHLFEELGWQYYGPLNGHDLGLLLQTLEKLKGLSGPRFLHLLTVKGQGLAEAAKDPNRYHGVSPSKKRTSVDGPAKGAATAGELPAPATAETMSFTKVFARALEEIGEQEERVVVITAAMPDGTGTTAWGKRFPERFFDVGICEQHAVAFASGLALAGRRPVCAIYSTFLQRAFDQVFQEICVQKAPVILCLDRGGLVGEDGPTHHGVFDVAYLRAFPNLVLLSPRDATELRKMLAFAVAYEDGPIALRYPRGACASPELPLPDTPIERGRAEVLREGREVAFVAYGPMAYTAWEAASVLEAEGLDPTVVNLRFVKPIDEDRIASILATHAWVFVLEEHALAGGAGSAILEVAESRGAPAGKIRRIGIPDRFVPHGAREIQLRECGLDVGGIVRRVREVLEGATSARSGARSSNGTGADPGADPGAVDPGSNGNGREAMELRAGGGAGPGPQGSGPGRRGPRGTPRTIRS